MLEPSRAPKVLPASPTVLYGPSQRPLTLFQPAEGWSAPGDCHGIAPRSLAGQNGQVECKKHLVPLLDRILTPRSAQRASPLPELGPAIAGYCRATGIPALDDAEVANLKAALERAERAHVLSLAESASLAMAAAEALYPGFASAGGRLWCVKEGHTASVWRASPPGTAAAPLCLLVPRDSEADAEQRQSFAELARLGPRSPVRVVHQRAHIELGYRGGSLTVHVTDWIEGARELNLVPTAQGARVLAVTSFAGGFRPVGRLLGAIESELTVKRMRALIRHSLVWDREQRRLLGFEINDGDFVLDARGELFAIASSAESPLRSASDLLIRYAGFGGTCARTGARLHVGNPSQLARELHTLREVDFTRAIRETLNHRQASERVRELAAALRQLA